jgi:hypothetical protein
VTWKPYPSRRDHGYGLFYGDGTEPSATAAEPSGSYTIPDPLPPHVRPAVERAADLLHSIKWRMDYLAQLRERARRQPRLWREIRAVKAEIAEREHNRAELLDQAVYDLEQECAALMEKPRTPKMRPRSIEDKIAACLRAAKKERWAASLFDGSYHPAPRVNPYAARADRLEAEARQIAHDNFMEDADAVE